MASKKRVKKAIKESKSIEFSPKPIKLPKKYTDFDLAQTADSEYIRGYKEGQADPPRSTTQEISDKERQEEATAAKIVADRLVEIKKYIEGHETQIQLWYAQYNFLKSNPSKYGLSIIQPSAIQSVYPPAAIPYPVGTAPIWTNK